jgi:hypothetical protein
MPVKFKKCKGKCGRLVPYGVTYCCSPCLQSDRFDFEIRDEQHTRVCCERYEERKEIVVEETIDEKIDRIKGEMDNPPIPEKGESSQSET